MEAFEDNVLLGEIAAVAGVLEPVVSDRLAGIRYPAALYVVEPGVDPFRQEGPERPDGHIVLVDDLVRRVAIGEHGVEALADRADLRGNSVALYAEMQVPIDVPVVVEIVPHEGLPGMLGIEKLVKERDHLGLVLRTIEVGGDAGEIDAFAQIVVAPILKPLEKDGDALRRGWLPVVVEHSPEVGGDRILLRKGQVDHWKDRPLAAKNAAEIERNHRVLDVFAVEVARNRGAEFGQSRGEVRGVG